MDEKTEIFEAKKNSVNVIVVVITIAAFFVMQFIEKSQTDGAFYGHTTQFLLEHGALYAPRLREGEWYRLITHMFLHGDIVHLFHNMLTLYCLGNALEHYVGKLPYLLLYFLSGIIAAMGSVVYNTDNPVCVGASGAVFGITGALLWLVLRNRGNLEGLTKQRMLLFVLLSISSGLGDYHVDNAAHVAGFLAGFLLAIPIYRKRNV